MASASAFNQAFSLHVKSLGPAASKALADTARAGEAQIIAEQTNRKGVPPGHIEAVDGRQGVPFEQVSPGGLIFAAFDYRAEIVAACFDELKVRSPVVSGDYIKNHFCMLDGQGLGPLEVPTALQVANVADITITNPMPYSRKLEVGLTEGGAPFVKQVDPHIYESACAAVQRVYGAVADIYFNYVDLEGAYVLKFNNVAYGRRSTFKDHKAGRTIRYPAIFIRQA